MDGKLEVIHRHVLVTKELDGLYEDEDTNRLSPLLYRKGSFEAYDREGKETAVSVSLHLHLDQLR